MDNLILKVIIENALIKKAKEEGVEFTQEDLEKAVQVIIDSGVTLEDLGI